MSLDAGPSRRTLLGVSAAACSACVLAACAPSGSGSGESATGGGQRSTAPGAASGTPVQVLKLADVAVGDSASGEANGQKLLVYRPDQETVEAFSAICTHQGCT